MTDIAEDFEENFENHKVTAAHRLRCLADVGEETILRIYDKEDLVAFFVDSKFYIDADQIELVQQNEDAEEKNNDSDE